MAYNKKTQEITLKILNPMRNAPIISQIHKNGIFRKDITYKIITFLSSKSYFQQNYSKNS